MRGADGSNIAGRAEAVGTIALAFLALVITWTVIRPSGPGPSGWSYDVERIGDWEKAIPSAIRVRGEIGAPVTILAFMDLECPASRDFHSTVLRVARTRSHEMRVWYLLYPLLHQRFSLEAARAVECAEMVGAASRLIDAIYANQDALGIRTWSEYAKVAGIRDSEDLQRCVETSADGPRVMAGTEFGEAISVVAIPTILVNGRRYEGTPSEDELNAAIDGALEETGVAVELYRSGDRNSPVPCNLNTGSTHPGRCGESPP